MYTLSSVRRVIAPLLVAVVAPLSAHAQEMQLFTWTGRVDREIRLTVRGGQVLNSTEQNMQTRGRATVNAALPNREGTLRIAQQNGRGSVTVDQQPTAQNGYTAIIRINDNDGGADNYRVTAFFDPSRGYGRQSNGDVNDRGVYGRNDDRGNRDRNNDGVDDRAERGNGRWGRNNEPALHWSGNVDGTVELVIRNGGIMTRVVNGASPSNVSSNVTGSNAQLDQGGSLQLAVREGRGRVEVIQEPSARNRYTGIIRIIDPQSGYGHYTFDVTLR